MDITAAMGQFYDEQGNINVPDQMTLSGMCEMLYTMAQMDGTAENVLIRYWDFSESREGKVHEITRAQVNTRIKAVCVRLQQIAKPGDRVAILANNSPEYMYAFLGAMYARMVPVPLYDPNEPGHTGHLTAVLGSSEPTVVLTNKRSATAVRKHFAPIPATERPRVLTIDALPDALAEDWVNPMAAIMADPSLAPKSSEEAFLQYTSGSTRTPAGVVLTHKSIVTTPQTEERPLTKWFKRDELSAGTVVEGSEDDADSLSLVSLGQVCEPQAIAIVDPESGKELADGQVGEIWVHGDNMAAGYLNRPEETEETFRNHLPMANRLESGSRAADVPEDKWMRTGDLAVIVDGHLFITGRLKDLIIVAGRNHYPQDIEATADEATEQTAPAVIAAFAVQAGDAGTAGAGADGESVEGLVIIAERDPEAAEADDAEAIEAMRAAVTATHGVQPSDVRIIAPGALPRSSANKIARRVAAKAYLEGTLDA